jgi:hypothetical protein
MWGYILILFLNDFPTIEVHERFLFISQEECMQAAKMVAIDQTNPMSAACMPVTGGSDG